MKGRWSSSKSARSCTRGFGHRKSMRYATCGSWIRIDKLSREVRIRKRMLQSLKGVHASAA